MEALGVLARLIEQSRMRENVKDGFDLQQELLRRLEAERLAWPSGAVKRIGGSNCPRPGKPEPRSGLEMASLEAWQIDHDVCERPGRQYRSIDDAVAWRVFGSSVGASWR
jgi:hypothetical protein